MLHDVESLQTRLGKLDGFDDTGSFLRGVIESKKIETPKEGAPGDKPADSSDPEAKASERASSPMPPPAPPKDNKTAVGTAGKQDATKPKAEQPLTDSKTINSNGQADKNGKSITADKGQDNDKSMSEGDAEKGEEAKE